MTPLIAIGIGCRRNCPAETIAALVRRALETVEVERAGLCHPRRAATGDSVLGSRNHQQWRRGKGIHQALPHLDSLSLASDCVRGSAGNDNMGSAAPSLFTSQAKADENGVVQAAAILGMELIPLSRTELEAAAPRCVTHSERIEALLGLPSLAEAAALAGAGPHSQLILARISEGGASCAVAMPEAVALPEETAP